MIFEKRPTRPQIDVMVLGASGYGGGELLRLLWAHPAVASIRGTARARAGQPFGCVHPNLRGAVKGIFDAEPYWSAFKASPHPVVFSALPHFELAQRLPALETAWAQEGLGERITLIDLSGDFRLEDAGAFEAAYGKPHPYPQGLGAFVYGLSEWNREALRGAKRIANPGCFATAVQLALMPMADLDLGFVAVSGVTGSSGSGAVPSETTHHPLRAEDFRAYKPLAHPHQAEIETTLAKSGGKLELAFVPHSAPMVRGIYATAQFALPRGLSAADLQERFEKAYAHSPFVHMVEGSPRIAAVHGSNHCDIALHVRGRQVAILAALDNLVKGMAGQAIQNMNLALGLPETEALAQPGLYP